jgi:HlyD family secretion protein
VATAQAQVASAQAAVKQAQANLDAANLVAPFDGTVASIAGYPGQFISGGAVNDTTVATSASTAALLTLIDTNNLQVTAQVNEADIGKVKIGDPVNFNVEAFPNQTFTGQVVQIQPVGTTVQNVVNYNVTSSIQSTKNANLYPGMTATVNIITAQDNNAVLVPNTALTFSQQAFRQGLVQGFGNGATGQRQGGQGQGNRQGGQGQSDQGVQGQANGAAGQARQANGGNGQGGQANGSGQGAGQSRGQPGQGGQGQFGQAGAGGQGAAGNANRGLVIAMQNGKLVPVRVTLGDTDGSTTVVASGLQPGETIVVGMTGGSQTTGSTGSSNGQRGPGGPGGPGGGVFFRGG